MKEHPILFSASMVRALLDGSKTQTRRVVKGSDKWPAIAVRAAMAESRGTAMAIDAQRCSYGPEIKCPYGKTGDRLWVRETHFINHFMGAQTPVEERAGCEIMYRATDMDYVRNLEDDEGLVWKPSIHMPRWASRITLEVTGVRVEYLQDISEADAIAEGIDRTSMSPWQPGECLGPKFGPEANRYRVLWESINGPGSWDVNPWVWVVEFTRCKP